MFQFSLRTMFVVTTTCAVLAWILFVPPEWAGVLVLSAIFLFLPAANLAGLIYHSGAWRAFFIGTSPWVVVTSWYAIMTFLGNGQYWPRGMGGFETKLFLLFVLAIVAGSGMVAVAIRWWSIRIAQPPRGLSNRS